MSKFIILNYCFDDDYDDDKKDCDKKNNDNKK